MRQLNGWWWPDSDLLCGPAILRELDCIERGWLRYAPGPDVVVQAGGNCGVYPQTLAPHFGTVYTFEPDPENFACLQRNVTATNVQALRAALGEVPGTTGLHRVDGNVGAHWMEGEGDIPVLTIDGLALDACDLIALDIEGAEWPALKGAVDTLERFHPAIVIEDKGHGRRFGYSDDELHDWLRGMGYTLRTRIYRDSIWT